MLGQSFISRAELALLTAVGVLATLAPGCTDLRDYPGVWQGDIVRKETLRLGFDDDAEMTLNIDAIDRTTLTGTISITPSENNFAEFDQAPLQPVEPAQHDVLSNLDFDGDPIATYIFFASPVDPAEDDVMVLISAHPQKRIEVRLLRNDLYGIFILRQQ